jgi:DNA-binding CsgD family transcriptional regulator
VAGRMTISERDVRTMLCLVADPGGEDPTEPLPWSLLAGLKELIPCHTVQIHQFDSQSREEVLDQELSDYPETEWPDDDLSGAFWEHYWNSASCCYPDVSGDLVTVTKGSDFYSDRELHASPMYVDYLGKYDREREMMLCLPSRPGRVLRLLFWRGPGSDFSDRDRALLTLLRPHLHTAYQSRRRQPTRSARLTPRQCELLRLVALGYTNHQVARRLSVTESTVRKHLEHIFERLQVTSRTAAVTQAFGPEPGWPQPMQ